MNKTKPRLIILSDIFGKENSTWLPTYTDHLQDAFDIHFYDCAQLARIDISADEPTIHQQFIYDGMEKAVEKLLLLESSEVYVLGFSIGGTIAWRAALLGLKIAALFAVSSTRLRLEIRKPDTNVVLVYGENDANKPNEEWFKTLMITPTIIKSKNHAFYREAGMAKQITIVMLDAINYQR